MKTTQEFFAALSHRIQAYPHSQEVLENLRAYCGHLLDSGMTDEQAAAYLGDPAQFDMACELESLERGSGPDTWSMNVNDLKNHEYGAIDVAQFDFKVIRSGQLKFPKPITCAGRFNMEVSTSGRIYFDDECTAPSGFDLTVSTTAGINFAKIKQGNFSACIHTGVVTATYQAQPAGVKVNVSLTLNNYGVFNLYLPSGAKACVVGQNGFSRYDFHDVSITDSSNCDYYIVISGKMAARCEINYA